MGNYAILVEDETGDQVWKASYGLKAFSPIAAGYGYSHCDDFGVGRSYGFARKHLGNDLMGALGTPIVAVEAGTVEAMGWNQYGGWRVGIRSLDSRRYYYYAHLQKDTPSPPASRREIRSRPARSSASWAAPDTPPMKMSTTLRPSTCTLAWS